MEFEQVAAAGGDVYAAVARRLKSGTSHAAPIIPLAQEIAQAQTLAGRGLTVADILGNIERRVEQDLRIARATAPVRPNLP